MYLEVEKVQCMIHSFDFFRYSIKISCLLLQRSWMKSFAVTLAMSGCVMSPSTLRLKQSTSIY